VGGDVGEAIQLTAFSRSEGMGGGGGETVRTGIFILTRETHRQNARETTLKMAHA
jgi:hypothetical protein